MPWIQWTWVRWIGKLGETLHVGILSGLDRFILSMDQVHGPIRSIKNQAVRTGPSTGIT